jgi:hypothetical protein
MLSSLATTLKAAAAAAITAADSDIARAASGAPAIVLPAAHAALELSSRSGYERAKNFNFSRRSSVHYGAR